MKKKLSNSPTAIRQRRWRAKQLKDYGSTPLQRLNLQTRRKASNSRKRWGPVELLLLESTKDWVLGHAASHLGRTALSVRNARRLFLK